MSLHNWGLNIFPFTQLSLNIYVFLGVGGRVDLGLFFGFFLAVVLLISWGAEGVLIGVLV